MDNLTTGRRVFLILLGAIWSWAGRGAEPMAVFHVVAGDRPQLNTPVSVAVADLAEPLSFPGAVFRLDEVAGEERRPTPVQFENGEPPRLWWILSGATAAGQTRVYELTGTPPEEGTAVETILRDGALDLVCAGTKILRYHSELVDPPAGVSDLYARSGFIHPVWAPSGEELTRIHAPDHIHHYGLWGPWTKVEFEGQLIDFWNVGQGQGTVRFAQFLDRTAGPVFGGFRAVQDHVWRKAPGGTRPVLREVLEVRAWNVGRPEAGHWLVDYLSTLTCATNQPVHLKQYRYGGLGIRGPEGWHNSNSDYLTSEGQTRANGDGTQARWCDVFGHTGLGYEGILFLSHPQNRAHPEPMRIWPLSANQGTENVFFNFCPVRDEDWTLEPGREYVLRYRLYGHAGKVKAAQAELVWQDWAQPPGVTRVEPTPPEEPDQGSEKEAVEPARDQGGTGGP